MGSSRRPAASYFHGLVGPTRYTAARPFAHLWRSPWALTKDATAAALVKELRATMAAKACKCPAPARRRLVA